MLKPTTSTFLVGLLVPWHGLLPAGAADMLLLVCQVIMYLALAVTLVTGLMYVRDAARISRGQEGVVV